MGIKINQLPDLTNVAGTDMFPADDSGGTTGKHTLAKIAEYAVSAFEITLGGISRTVKTAIDAIQTLLGSTSISGIGDGTVTGAISSLNSNLAQLSQMIYTKTFSCENISITAGTAGTRGGQKMVDVAVSGYTPISVGLTQVNDSSLANVVPFFGSNGNPNTVFVNAYRASGGAGTVSGIYFRVIYIKS